MTSKMLEALSKSPRLRLVDEEARILTGETARFDGWMNDVTGQGTARDKTAFNYFAPGRILQDGELSGLYHDNDVAARMVDIVPDEMLREGFTVDVGDAKANAELADLFDALGLDDKLADANRWGRLYGGGGLLIGADDGRSASQPLIPDRAGALTYVYVLDRRYLWPLTYYNEPGHPKLGQPETFMVTSPSYSAQAPVAVVHETRLVLFGGSSTGIRERETNAGWDLSILQRATKVLADFDLGWGAVSVLLADGNQGVFKIAGLAEAIAQSAAGGGAAGGETFLRERLRLLDMGRSVVRAITVDAGGNDEPAEDFTRQHFPMTGIPETLEKLCVRLAVTADVPCTRLFGISPAGLNATGESDIRGWYDRIRSKQTRKLAPAIRRIARVALQTKALKLDRLDTIKVSFPSLWSEAPQQAATTRKALIDGDVALVNAGVVLPEEVALARFRPDGFAQEIALDDKAREVRASALSSELTGMLPDTEAPEVPKVEIAPTDVAATLTVNEVRATQGFGPIEGPDGKLSVAEFKAKTAAPAGGGFGGRPGTVPRTDGADDQPRDEIGQFASTAGGGGSASDDSDTPREQRPARLEVARERHAEAQQKAQAAKAELEQAEQDHEAAQREALGKIEQIKAEREKASKEARALADEAKQALAAEKEKKVAFIAEVEHNPFEVDVDSVSEAADARAAAARKLERAERATKAHEREVSRLQKAIDRDGDGRTGAAELKDDAP